MIGAFAAAKAFFYVLSLVLCGRQKKTPAGMKQGRGALICCNSADYAMERRVAIR